MKKPRVVDIARIANVSPSTVSLALNNKTGVSDALRERIISAAKGLGYSSPDSPGDNGGNISVLFLQIAKHGHIVNNRHYPFITEYLRSIETEAKIRKYKLEISFFNMAPVEEIIAAQQETRANGFIVLGTELDGHELYHFAALQRPVVFIDTCFPCALYTCVDMDNQDSAFKAVEHLYKCGHRQIGLIKSSYETRNFKLREFGFREAMEFFSMPVQEKHIVSVDPTLEGSNRDMDKYLSRNIPLPTAFFCMSDIMSYSCVQALRKHHVNVPDDISIIGFDDLPASGLYEPPLTSIRVSSRQIGRRAMEKLSEQINFPPDYEIENILVPGNLVIRNSVKKV